MIKTMKALEFYLNGKKQHVAALADGHVLTELSFGEYPPSIDGICVRGFDVGTNFLWHQGTPQQGDKVVVRVVETDEPSPPLCVKELDRERLRRQYEWLKAELEKEGLI